MAKQVWYPENGDEVRLLDGSKGMVTDSNQDPLSTGEGSWQVEVQFESDPDHDDLTRAPEDDVEIQYNESKKMWEEVGL